MKKGILFFAWISLIVIFNSCEDLVKSDLQTNAEITSIGYGTSFGECIGYCNHKIIINQNRASYTETSINADFPDIELDLEMDNEKWNELTSKIDFIVFRNLSELIGCPDCADGGAEWIEIETKNITHKVTFEYLNEPETLKEISAVLRELMNNFKD